MSTARAFTLAVTLWGNAIERGAGKSQWHFQTSIQSLQKQIKAIPAGEKTLSLQELHGR
jgi:hypothetical protein